MVNPNDAIRDSLLRYLYEVHQAARSVKSAAIGIRDLQSAMKSRYGVKQQETARNLDYLLQKGWVSEVVEERSFTTARGTQQSSPRITYKISDVGIDLLEGASMYERPFGGGGVNITTIKGVTVVGDGNVVNLEFIELSKALQELRDEVVSSDLEDRSKLEALADIDALTSQLQKPAPDPTVVQRLWEGLEKAALIAGATDLAARIGDLLGPLLG
jgi:hypothetical protein